MDRNSSLYQVPHVQSPYLQFDHVPQQTEFIVPDGGARRGRFELAFSQIGASVMTGAGIGACVGGARGMRALPNDSFSVRRSALLNHVTRNGASVANVFGTCALVYSAIGVGLSFARDDDEWNTIAAAGATGAMYGGVTRARVLQSQLKRSIVGAIVGTCIACAYVTLFRDK